jgi:hypothetical protein
MPSLVYGLTRKREVGRAGGSEGTHASKRVISLTLVPLRMPKPSFAVDLVEAVTAPHAGLARGVQPCSILTKYSVILMPVYSRTRMVLLQKSE